MWEQEAGGACGGAQCVLGLRSLKESARGRYGRGYICTGMASEEDWGAGEQATSAFMV